MTGGLSEFTSRDYIDWSPEAALIDVNRIPTDGEIQAMLSDSGTGF